MRCRHPPKSSNTAALPFIFTFRTVLTIPGQPRILFSSPFSSQSVIMPSALLINYFPYIISCSSLSAVTSLPRDWL